MIVRPDLVLEPILGSKMNVVLKSASLATYVKLLYLKLHMTIVTRMRIFQVRLKSKNAIIATPTPTTKEQTPQHKPIPTGCSSVEVPVCRAQNITSFLIALPSSV